MELEVVPAEVEPVLSMSLNFPKNNYIRQYHRQRRRRRRHTVSFAK